MQEYGEMSLILRSDGAETVENSLPTVIMFDEDTNHYVHTIDTATPIIE